MQHYDAYIENPPTHTEGKTLKAAGVGQGGQGEFSKDLIFFLLQKDLKPICHNNMNIMKYRNPSVHPEITCNLYR